jgi:hypothetical protein
VREVRVEHDVTQIVSREQKEKMPKKTIDLWSDAVEPFLKHLKNHDRFKIILTGYNSFEGWLKWEFAAFLCEKYEWIRLAGKDQNRLLSIEWSPKLDQVPGNDKAKNMVDLCFPASSDPEDFQYHYLELKVVFQNQHTEKQAKSAGSDLRYLAAMNEDDAAPASIGSLAFLVRPPTANDDEKSAWKNFPNRVSKIATEACSPVVATSNQFDLSDNCSAVYFGATWKKAHDSLVKRER